MPTPHWSIAFLPVTMLPYPKLNTFGKNFGDAESRWKRWHPGDHCGRDHIPQALPTPPKDFPYDDYCSRRLLKPQNRFLPKPNSAGSLTPWTGRTTTLSGFPNVASPLVCSGTESPYTASFTITAAITYFQGVGIWIHGRH